jgi:hypothetical protein
VLYDTEEKVDKKGDWVTGAVMSVTSVVHRVAEVFRLTRLVEEGKQSIEVADN